MRLKKYFSIIIFIFYFSQFGTVLAQDVIKIGCDTPLTGSGASAGTFLRWGFEVAIDDINAEGGILGKKVIGVIRDDETKPQKAITNVKDMIYNEKVVAITGPVNSGNALAFMHINQQERIPLMVTIATATEITLRYQNEPKNYIFRYSLLDKEQIRLMVAWAVRKFKKIAIAADSTGYGEHGKKDLLEEFSKYGVTPVAIEKFNLGDTDMTSQLLKIKAAGAEAVAVYSLGPEIANLVKSAQKINYRPVFFGSWAFFNFEVQALPHELSNGLIGVSGATPDVTSRAAELDRKVRQKFAGDKYYDFTPVSTSYDGTRLLAQAIRNAGSTNGEKIRDAIENIPSYQSVTKILVKPFSKIDHEALSAEDMFLATYKNGRVIKYEDEVTRSLILK